MATHHESDNEEPEHDPHVGNGTINPIVLDDRRLRVIEAQLFMVRLIRNRIRSGVPGEESFEMNLMHLSALLVSMEMDNTLFEDWKKSPFACRLTATTLRDMMINVGPFLSILRGSLNHEITPEEAQEEQVQRTHRQEEISATRTRCADECFITGCTDTEVVEIVSRNVNNTEANYERTESVMVDFFTQVTGFLYYCDVCDIILKASRDDSPTPILNSCDKAFNMFCLDRQLSRYWREGYFGLKPVKCEDSTGSNGEEEFIAVEFRWLITGLPSPALDDQHTLPGQEEIKDPYKIVNLDSENLASFVLERLETQERAERDDVPQIDSRKTGRGIMSGTKFYLKASRADAKKTRDLLELQWMTAQMAALCGATPMMKEILAELPAERAY